MSSITVEAILESFLTNLVSKIEGEPTYESLRLLERVDTECIISNDRVRRR